MLIELKNSKNLSLALSVYFLFFMGWVQFHHGHDPSEELACQMEVGRVVVVGGHCHATAAGLPILEHHEIISKPPFHCLLCTFTDWTFLFGQGTALSSSELNTLLGAGLPEDLLIAASCPSYRLRAPPCC